MIASRHLVERSIPQEPLAVITETDKGGLIVVITALSLSFVLVSYLIRVYIRLKDRAWKVDDHAYSVAVILACIQTAVVFNGVHHGWGKAEDLLSSQQIHDIQKSSYAAALLYIITIFCSKCSFGLLYLRLTPSRTHKLIVCAILAACTVWLVMSLFLIGLRCHISTPWKDWTTTQCSSLLIRWQVVGAIDITTEVALFGMSIYMLYNLQMALKLKAIVVGAFAARMLVVAAIIVRLHFLASALNPTNSSTKSTTLLSVFSLICMELEIGYGILAAGIPCLKPFVAAYKGPKQGGGFGYGTEGSYKLSNISHTTSGQNLDSADRTSPAGVVRGGAITDSGLGRFRAEKVKYTATISHMLRGGQNNSTSTNNDTSHSRAPSRTQDRWLGKSKHKKSRAEGGSFSSSEESSRRMIIQKKVDWSVEEQAVAPSPTGSRQGRYNNITKASSGTTTGADKTADDQRDGAVMRHGDASVLTWDPRTAATYGHETASVIELDGAKERDEISEV